MSNSKSGSKRQALRFIGREHPLSFKTEFEDGDGVLANISAKGCAIRAASLHLSSQEKILILLNLGGDDVVEIGGRVVRNDGDLVAVEFVYLGDGVQKRIVSYFAERQRTS